MILRPGELNTRLYALVSGRLRVQLTPLEDGPVVTLEAGDCVGEISLIDGQPASALVSAESECDILVIEQATLWALMERSGDLARNLLGILSRRLRNNNLLVASTWSQQRDLHDEARRDALTGLLNRRGLRDSLARLMAECVHDATPLTLLVIDVDSFKMFNDRYGHPAGDEVLSAIGQVVSRSLRPSDLAARFGGDELVVGLMNATAEQGRQVAERIRQAVRRIRPEAARADPPPAPTLSVGVAELRPGQDLDALFKAADQALYQAKAGGRDRIAFAPVPGA